MIQNILLTLKHSLLYGWILNNFSHEVYERFKIKSLHSVIVPKLNIVILLRLPLVYIIWCFFYRYVDSQCIGP